MKPSSDPDQTENRLQITELPHATELLCRCATWDEADGDWNRIKELFEVCDHERILQEITERHRMPARLLQSFEELNNAGNRSDEPVPTSVLDPLREETRRIAVQNLAATNELNQILTYIERADIPAIPFKGPVVALQLFGDITHRHFVDLDVMVPRDQLIDAYDVLCDEGYEPNWNPDSPEGRMRVLRGAHLGLQRNGPQIELHSQLSPKQLAAPIGYGWLAERTADVELDGLTVPGLQPEPLLVLLSIHGTKHRWKRLKWLYDVKKLLDSKELDWELLAQEADRLGRRRAVNIGLVLAAELLDASVPDQHLARAKTDNFAMSFASSIQEETLTSGNTETESSPGVTDVLRQLHGDSLLLDTRRERLKVFGRFLFEPRPREGREIPLPEPLDPVYYLIRPLRLTWSAIKFYGKKVFSIPSG